MSFLDEVAVSDLETRMSQPNCCCRGFLVRAVGSQLACELVHRLLEERS
jgi:hypothetical protein